MIQGQHTHTWLNKLEIKYFSFLGQLVMQDLWNIFKKNIKIYFCILHNRHQ